MPRCGVRQVSPSRRSPSRRAAQWAIRAAQKAQEHPHQRAMARRMWSACLTSGSSTSEAKAAVYCRPPAMGEDVRVSEGARACICVCGALVRACVLHQTSHPLTAIVKGIVAVLIRAQGPGPDSAKANAHHRAHRLASVVNVFIGTWSERTFTSPGPWTAKLKKSRCEYCEQNIHSYGAGTTSPAPAVQELSTVECYFSLSALGPLAARPHRA